MKKKNKHSTKYRRKKEFRFRKIETINRKGKMKLIKHPCYIFLEKEQIYLYVSLTHSKEIKDAILVKLRVNPNKNDTRDSYYVAEIKESYKKEFDKIMSNWVMNPEDDKDIRKLFDKTKKDDSAA